jgi:hypothetical protein
MEGLYPASQFHELHGICAGVEIDIGKHREDEGDDGHRQRQYLDGLFLSIARIQHPDAAQDGRPDQQAEQRKMKFHPLSR